VTPLVVFTIGHSTRPIEDFIRLLKEHRVQRVIDVRTIPRSRHNPQFNRDQLSPALHRARIHYRYMPGLGGLRRARRDSINVAWRNASFRGYADYMHTSTFRESLDRCTTLAKRERVVLMCAEGVPWHCHRSLIADALLDEPVGLGHDAVNRLGYGAAADPDGCISPDGRLLDGVLPCWRRVRTTAFGWVPTRWRSLSCLNRGSNIVDSSSTTTALAISASVAHRVSPAIDYVSSTNLALSMSPYRMTTTTTLGWPQDLSPSGCQ
jgi:hypothetical protein